MATDRLREHCWEACRLAIDPSNPTDLLRWWHQYQAQMLNRESDLIRNGLLQEMFALRRRLEVACQAHPNPDDFSCEVHLAELKQLYTSLETICDRLESPFLQDSLPLAIQHMLRPWQGVFPLEVELAKAWDPEPVEHTRLLVLLVKQLFEKLTEAPILPQQGFLTLEQSAKFKTIRIQIEYGTWYPNAFVEKILQELTPFLKTFHLFTQGEFYQEHQEDSFALILCWQVQNLSASNLNFV